MSKTKCESRAPKPVHYDRYEAGRGPVETLLILVVTSENTDAAITATTGIPDPNSGTAPSGLSHTSQTPSISVSNWSGFVCTWTVISVV